MPVRFDSAIRGGHAAASVQRQPDGLQSRKRMFLATEESFQAKRFAVT